MKSYRKNGKLTIEISEEAIITAGEYEYGKLGKEIKDTSCFLDFCCAKIVEMNIGVDQGNDGIPVLSRLMDDVIASAIEHGEGT